MSRSGPAPTSDAATMARWLARIVAVACALTLLSVALELTPDANPALLFAMAGAGLPIALAIRAFGDRLPAAVFAWLLMPGLTLLLVAGIAVSGEPANPASAVLILGAVFSAYCFSRGVAAAHLALSAVGYGAALVSLGASFAALDRWLFTLGVALLTAGVVAALRDELVARAAVDPLTGVLNRRGFQDRLAGDIARGRETGRPVALLCVDVDHLKAVNDGGGHAAGDAALQAVVEALVLVAREPGRVGRLGGDEFAVVIPDADRAAARRSGDELRRRVRAAGHGVTVSIGATATTATGDAPAALLAAADAALYEAKRAGRDRLVLAGAHTAGERLAA